MICPVCSHDNLPGAEQCGHCLQDLTQLDRPTAHDRVERSLLEDRVAVLNPRPAGDAAADGDGRRGHPHDAGEQRRRAADRGRRRASCWAFSASATC